MTDINVPELGESIIEGTLTSWLVKEGSSFQAGDNLAEIETEKITIEIPAQSAGTISKILVTEGSSVKVGEVIAQFSQGGEATTSPPSKAKKEETPAPSSKAVEELKLEKRVENQQKNLEPTFSNFDEPTDKEGERSVPMSKLRQTIARRLKDAQNTAAILTTFNEVDMTAIMALRKKQQATFQKKHGVKLGIMSFFVKACVQVLKELPEINSEIFEDKIIYKNYFDIGVAIGSEKGLVVPIIRNAENLTNAEIEKNH